MLRRLHPEQPDAFAFTPANQAWAEAQMTKYPEGRQASAIIPLLWRAQEQEGWLTRPAIEYVSEMLGMAYIRGLEVATFYFMFQLQPVGSVAHIQICGTTTCMICGAEDLIGICKEKIAPNPHEISADGKFSWEEVECLGACSNAPMAQIGKDYYEDLTGARLVEMLDDLAAGKVPTPGPQNGRYASEPLSGLTSLTDHESGKTQYNASVQLATDIGDTVKRIDGTEVPLLAPWQGKAANSAKKPAKAKPAAKKPAAPTKAKTEPKAAAKAEPASKAPTQKAAGKKAAGTAAKAAATAAPKKPRTMKAPRKAGADDLKLIKGIGPKLEQTVNSLGFFHFDQIAKWGQDELAWVDQNLEGFKGRASRDGWVEQAEKLARGEETEFSAKASKDGRYD
ncbi:NADH-quinone oxidoreductase subunit E [Sulfitobacter donghicola]|uniref:NADH dehydrogenase subunit E n=1 Tax=Sulfitobacter donghicola DSW-25 = KCTC 12864 = JCM 14565 TaxID=1300350 RepID=A0A073IIM1_9RHOB|nr:NADH-quinone oxidoreductase subunit E [Sulfitobacter donghicola]KEJ89420.1 NADH dehydrogenase subunit E [Sulfitobacter donghicola DSW-25 = KCTC 12864 = JCM 14565]KIN69239.1 NADH-ubiquinone oxidoreductase chain E [Sulfitobacter donghicola DSW-25 = KCTC 12864 = JCM 14565]